MSAIEKFFNKAISLKATDHMFFIPEMKGHKVNLYYNAVTEELFHVGEKSITKLSVISRPAQNHYRHYSVSIGTQDGKQKKIAIKQQLLDEYVKEQIKNRYDIPEVQRSIDTRLEKIPPKKAAKKATKKNVSKKKTTIEEKRPFELDPEERMAFIRKHDLIPKFRKFNNDRGYVPGGPLEFTKAIKDKHSKEFLKQEFSKPETNSDEYEIDFDYIEKHFI